MSFELVVMNSVLIMYIQIYILSPQRIRDCADKQFITPLRHGSADDVLQRLLPSVSRVLRILNIRLSSCSVYRLNVFF